jgi:hypothetical protein
VEAYLLDENEDAFIDALRKGASRYSSVNLDHCISDISAPSDKKATLSRLYHQALDQNFVPRLLYLQARLKDIVRISRHYGTMVVFLTYPTPPQHHINEMTRSVAEETGTSWLNLSARFEVLMKTKGVREKIIKDGRLTDEAYREIAQWIAEDIQYRNLPEISPQRETAFSKMTPLLEDR